MTCICTCMQRAQLLLLPLSAQKPLCSSIHPSLLPNSSQRQHASGAFLPELWEEQCGGGGGRCVGAEVILAAPARDWSCSQSCAQTAFLMLREECGLMSSRRARGLHLGRLSRRINDQKIIFRLLNNPFMLHEKGGKKVQREFGKKSFHILGFL